MKSCLRRPFLPLLAVLAFASCSAQRPLPDGLYAKISTDKGEILVELEAERAPLSVTNFVGLAEGTLGAAKGKPFYDGLVFHRVIKDFMIQGGDPQGDGSGGPGYAFPDEISQDLSHDGPGIMGMANAGPNTNGSQFYITHRATEWLDGKYPIFGRLVSGQEVVNLIEAHDVIKKVEILRYGSRAQAFKADQAAFDSLRKKQELAIADRRKAKREETSRKIEATYPGILDQGNGIKYWIMRPGTGDKPASGKTVFVLYKGKFLDGKVFDSSELRGNTPIQFKPGSDSVIKAWSLAVTDMRVGEKRGIIVPPELAYGEEGAGNGFIPPDEWLVFELELTAAR